MKKTLTIEEAYELAMSAVPGRANSKVWELCRHTTMANLAGVFGVEPAFPTWKPSGKVHGQPGGKQGDTGSLG